MLLTIAKDPKLLRLLPYRSTSSPNRTSKTQQMATQSTFRLALLYTILTTHFIAQTCASHPLMRRCDVFTYTNMTLMLTMCHKERSPDAEKHQPLGSIETRTSTEEKHALLTHLQQPNTRIRSHQQTSRAQHQQNTTQHQTSKRKVSSITSITKCSSLHSLHSMQITGQNAHTANKIDETSATADQTRIMQEAETTNTRTKLRPCRTTPQTPKKLGRQAAQTQATPKRRQQANTSTDPWPAYLYQENTSTKQIQIPASAQHAKKTETTRRLKQVQNRDKNLSPKEAQHTRTDTTQKWISMCPTRDKNLSLSNLRQLEGLQTQYTKAEQDQRLPATPVTPPRHRRNGVTTPTPTRRRPACRRKLRSTAAVTSPNTSALGTGTNKHRKHCTRDHANPPKVATLPDLLMPAAR